VSPESLRDSHGASPDDVGERIGLPNLSALDVDDRAVGVPFGAVGRSLVLVEKSASEARRLPRPHPFRKSFSEVRSYLTCLDADGHVTAEGAPEFEPGRRNRSAQWPTRSGRQLLELGRLQRETASKSANPRPFARLAQAVAAARRSSWPHPRLVAEPRVCSTVRRRGWQSSHSYRTLDGDCHVSRVT
jgi:hypothetical protein